MADTEVIGQDTVLEALRDDAHPAHSTAPVALGRIGLRPEVVVPALIDALTKRELRDAACIALGDFGPRAQSALPFLLRLAAEGQQGSHDYVSRAMQMISANGGAGLAVLRIARWHPEWAVRWNATSTELAPRVNEMAFMIEIAGI